MAELMNFVSRCDECRLLFYHESQYAEETLVMEKAGDSTSMGDAYRTFLRSPTAYALCNPCKRSAKIRGHK